MAGIDAQKVYLPTPDQSATTGAVAVAPVGTTAPTDARTALPNDWDTGGYVDENGLSLSLTRSITPIKDWSQATVRNALTEFDGTLSFAFLQIDQFAAERILGTDNVEVTAATASAGEILKWKIGAELPDIEAWCFSMKDGNRRVRVYCPNAQITELTGDITFVPNAANVWGCSLAAYPDENGKSIYVIYDDGVVVSG